MTSISPPEGQDKILLELAARCEAATGPDRELDEQIALAKGLKPTVELGDPALGNHRFVPAHVRPYTASLDAAMALVPEGLDFGCGRGIDTELGPNKTICHAWVGEGEGDLVFAETVALSLCAAALRALNQVRAIL